MAAELVGGDELFADHRLRGGHQRGVGSGGGLVFRIPLPSGRHGAGRARPRISPEIRKRGRFLAVGAQQRQRISQIGIEQRMVPDHRPRPRIALQRRAIHPQRPAPARQRLGNAQRGCGAQQALGRGKAQPGAVRRRCRVARSFRQQIEQPALDAGCQHLRIGKSGHQIERPPRAGAHDWPRQREGRAPLLELRVRQKAVAPADPALPEPGPLWQIQTVGHIHMSITFDI